MKKVDKSRTCVDCIHECACQSWSGNAIIHDMKTNCKNYETVKSSGVYYIGVLDGMKSQVNHAHWSKDMVCIKDSFGDMRAGYQCSRCGVISNKTSYCGRCGAKMDEEEQNE